MDNHELLQIARYYADSFREIHDGPVPDVAGRLAGIVTADEDVCLMTAAILYPPVVFLMPSEEFISKTYDPDVFALLMETTYDPAFGQARRMAETTARMRDMDRRTLMLQLAVLHGFLDLELALAVEEGRSPLDYCRWLEQTVSGAADQFPRQVTRIQSDLHSHFSDRE